MKALEILIAFAAGVFVGAVVGFGGGVVGSAAAMRETMLERDQYRDLTRDRARVTDNGPSDAAREAGAQAFLRTVTGRADA